MGFRLAVFSDFFVFLPFLISIHETHKLLNSLLRKEIIVRELFRRGDI